MERKKEALTVDALNLSADGVRAADSISFV